MDTNLQTFTVLILLLALVVRLVLQPFLARRARLAVRAVPAYDLVPRLVGQAVETDRPILLSTGSAGIGGESTLLALAGAEAAFQVARAAAIAPTAPVFLTSDTTALALGYDTLRRAYASRGVAVRADATSVRWYPAGPQSLAFAALLVTTLYHERAAGAVWVGGFGPEVALGLEKAARNGLPTIVGTDQLSGMAVAYAMADGVLLGEDAFSAGAYLDEANPAGPRAALITQDVLRLLVVLTMVGLFAWQLWQMRG